ncbi:MAG: MerR family transcriptional regulator [Crocinitomicaceae bacterium]|nr:MerR family transcriptional regulator [Crocinitomicaceae bacterium]
MTTKTGEIEKLYYSIGEVAEMFEVNSSLIRFWEKEFPQLQPRKNNRGNRVYNKKDIDLFRKSHHLVKDRGFTLEGAKNALKKNDQEKNSELIIARLLSVREKLIMLESAL